MSTARFFCADLADEIIELKGPEAHHLAKVRRVRTGEKVELLDGAGNLINGRVSEINKNSVQIEVLDRLEKEPPETEITVAVALAKSSRWNWLLEKCVELGAANIWPVIFERSTVKGSGSAEQLSKWHKRCIEAAKQCGQAYLPRIAQPKSLAEIMEVDHQIDLKLVGTTAGSAKPILKVLEKAEKLESILLLVGPEGGLSEAEQRQVENHGYWPTFVGKNVLRVETAVVGLLAVVQAWKENANIKNKNAK